MGVEVGDRACTLRLAAPERVWTRCDVLAEPPARPVPGGAALPSPSRGARPTRYAGSLSEGLCLDDKVMGSNTRSGPSQSIVSR